MDEKTKDALDVARSVGKTTGKLIVATARATKGIVTSPQAKKAASTAAAKVGEVGANTYERFKENRAYQHSGVDKKTGTPVSSRAFVVNEDGTRDYDAVFPKGASFRDAGPVGNKVIGIILILAGIPMLVLPGPGLLAIAAGLAYMKK